jgi:hypothetical protein
MLKLNSMRTGFNDSLSRIVVTALVWLMLLTFEASAQNIRFDDNPILGKSWVPIFNETVAKYEFHNLIDDPEMAAVLAEMKEELNRLLQETGAERLP